MTEATAFALGVLVGLFVAIGVVFVMAYQMWKRGRL